MGGGSAFLKEVLLTLLSVEVVFQIFAHIVTLPEQQHPLTTSSSDHHQKLDERDQLELNTLSFLVPDLPNAESKPTNRVFGSSVGSSLKTRLLPRCKVLVTNRITNHAEVFESIMHLSSEMLSLTPPQTNNTSDITGGANSLNCNPNKLVFDFSLKADGMSWKEYFLNTLKAMYDENHPTIVAGEFVPYQPNTTDPKYAAIVEATCHCRRADVNWLRGYGKRRCVLHRKCLQLASTSQALSASPFNPRFFLPDVLPPAPQKQEPPKPPYELCVVGRNYRRNFEFVREYFDAHKGDEDFGPGKFVIQIYGSSEIKPPILRPYRKRVTLTNITEFDTYQRRVAQCDALLALVDTRSHPEYFRDQLTGTVPQASAYNIPIVLHHELVTLYKDHLPDMYEAHGDNNRTFVAALDRLIDRFDKMQQPETEKKRKKTKKAVA